MEESVVLDPAPDSVPSVIVQLDSHDLDLALDQHYSAPTLRMIGWHGEGTHSALTRNERRAGETVKTIAAQVVCNGLNSLRRSAPVEEEGPMHTHPATPASLRFLCRHFTQLGVKGESLRRFRRHKKRYLVDRSIESTFGTNRQALKLGSVLGNPGFQVPVRPMDEGVAQAGNRSCTIADRRAQ